jgi:PKD repeat protein
MPDYASDGTSVYKTIDGGVNWVTLVNPVAGTNYITYVAVAENNPDKIWLTYSGYTATKKVYKSIDGGTTWNNISLNLPNIPVNCAVNQAGTNDGIYVGTDVGVYYMDNNLTSWMPYSNGLPNVIAHELEIQYGSNKLRLATYGRGLWETTIYNPSSTLPFANFAADSVAGCPGITVQFSDSTINNPIAWNWSFPGGTPSTSTLQNPVVTYNTAGTYNDVKLVVSNLNGADSVTKLSYIAISPQVQPTIWLSTNDSICQGQTVQLISSIGNTYKWHPGNQGAQNINVNAAGTYSVTVTDAFGCLVTSQPLDIHVLPLPSVPLVTVNGDTLISSAASGYQWYLNGTLIPNAINQTYVMQGVGGLYKVVVTDTTGLCSASSASNYAAVEEYMNGVSYIVYPNPSNGIVNIVLQTDLKDNITIELADAIGRVVYKKEYPAFTGSLETVLDIGVYERGVYTFTIINSKGNASKKIIKY